MDTKKIEACARAAHEANRAYCIALGDTSQVPWDEAPTDIQNSAINGVMVVLNHPDATSEETHNNWLEFTSFRASLLGFVLHC